MPDQDWFYILEGQPQQGPVEFRTLVQWTQEGRIPRGTLVWHEGAADWQPLERVPELAEFLPTLSTGPRPERSRPSAAAAPVRVPERTGMAGLGRPVVGSATLPAPTFGAYLGGIVVVLIGLGFFALIAKLLVDDPAANRGLAVLFSLPAGILTLAGLVMIVQRYGTACSVQMYENGVAVERKGRVQSFAFADLALSLDEKDELSNGVRVGVRRDLRLVAPGAASRLAWVAHDGSPDPVGPVLNAIRARAVEEAERRLSAGGELRGRGWALNAAWLQPGSGAPVSLEGVTEVAEFSARVSVWAGDEERPRFSVDSGSENARVLQDVLARRLEGRRSPRADSGLGRVLFEKTTARSVIGVLVVLTTVAVGIAILLLSQRAWIESLAPATFAAAFGLFLVTSLVDRLSCHERGLAKRSLFGTTVLRYAEVDVLTYGATRHYRNGVYTGTNIQVAFHSDALRKTIRYSVTTQGGESDLELLRDQVAAMVAGRLYDRLARDGSVYWTPGVQLSRTGIHFRRQKTFGTGPEALVEYAGSTFRIDSGFFYLFGPGEEKSVLAIGCGDGNFWPGFLLFRRLAGESASAEAV